MDNPVLPVIPSRLSFARIFIDLTIGIKLPIQRRTEIDHHFHQITTTMNSKNQAQLISFLTPLESNDMTEDKVNYFLIICSGIIHYYPRLFINTLCSCNQQMRLKSLLLLRCFISFLILRNHSLQSVFHTRTSSTHRETCLVWTELIRRHHDTYPVIRQTFLEITSLILLSSSHFVDQEIQKSALSKLITRCQYDPILKIRKASLSLLTQLFEVDPTKVFNEEVFQMLHWLCIKEKAIQMRLSVQQAIFSIYENLLMHYPLEDFQNREVVKLIGVLVAQYRKTINQTEKKSLEDILRRMKQLHAWLKKTKSNQQ